MKTELFQEIREQILLCSEKYQFSIDENLVVMAENTEAILDPISLGKLSLDESIDMFRVGLRVIALNIINKRLNMPSESFMDLDVMAELIGAKGIISWNRATISIERETLSIELPYFHEGKNQVVNFYVPLMDNYLLDGKLINHKELRITA